MKDALQTLARENIPLSFNCPLAEHSTFRIGGIAAAGVFPRNREQLIRTLNLLQSSGIPFEVIGKGSNVLFPDGSYSGVIVFTGDCRELICEGSEITASAGVPLALVAAKAREYSLSGAEFAAGIPGTVGGAVFMNAGAFGGSMEQITVCSEYLDRVTGSIGTFMGEEQQFGVRTSVYQNSKRYTILGAKFRLREGNGEEIAARMKELQMRRKATQPLEFPNAGSIFRHPPGHYAGKLIEDCGLKGTSVGGAEVSRKHAGFIVNRGNATAEDVTALIALIRETVREKTGITLECELRIISDPHTGKVTEKSGTYS